MFAPPGTCNSVVEMFLSKHMHTHAQSRILNSGCLLTAMTTNKKKNSLTHIDFYLVIKHALSLRCRITVSMPYSLQVTNKTLGWSEELSLQSAYN